MALLEAFRRQAESHVRFFDHLVELVPAKHYVEREEPPANLKYLKKVWHPSPSSTCWPHPAHSGLTTAVHAPGRASHREAAPAGGWEAAQAREAGPGRSAGDGPGPAAAAGCAGGCQAGARAPAAAGWRDTLRRRAAAAPAQAHRGAQLGPLPSAGLAYYTAALLRSLVRQAMRQGRHADEPAGQDAAATPGGKTAQVQAAREWRRQAASKRCGGSFSACLALKRQVADRGTTARAGRGQRQRRRQRLRKSQKQLPLTQQKPRTCASAVSTWALVGCLP